MDRTNELVVVLNDGETFSSIEGCRLARVLYSEDDSGVIDDEKWDEKVKSFERQGMKVWEDQEYGLICEVVLSF